MSQQGMPLPQDKVFINCKIDKKIMQEYISHFIGRQAEWISAYDEVLKWLNGNEGKGLFMFGDLGLGKTILAKYVIPALILSKHNKVVRYFDMNHANKHLDDVLRCKIIALDDVGTEEEAVSFGNRRTAFAEVMDAAEKESKLVIISTNLNAQMLREKYGDRVMDRILSTTRRVLFEGKSFRKVNPENQRRT